MNAVDLQPAPAATWKQFYKRRRKELYRLLYKTCGGVVRHGPFAGMKLQNKGSWAGGALGPKLLGTYEQELHEPLQEAFSFHPSLIIDVGCAEGYYAVGVAIATATARVIAFDISDTARLVCSENARLNDVASRVEVRGACDHAALNELLPGNKTVLISDCEGFERELIDPDRVASLRDAFLIVELHPAPSLTVEIEPIFFDRFRDSHHLRFIGQAGRNPHELSELQSLSEVDKFISICEFRAMTMKWLVAVPRSWSSEPTRLAGVSSAI